MGGGGEEEFAVATATAQPRQRDIFRDRARHIRRSNCHGGLQGGALGHSAQNIGPKRVFQPLAGVPTRRRGAVSPASQPEEAVSPAAQQPAPEGAHRECG